MPIPVSMCGGNQDHSKEHVENTKQRISDKHPQLTGSSSDAGTSSSTVITVSDSSMSSGSDSEVEETDVLSKWDRYIHDSSESSDSD